MACESWLALVCVFAGFAYPAWGLTLWAWSRERAMLYKRLATPPARAAADAAQEAGSDD